MIPSRPRIVQIVYSLDSIRYGGGAASYGLKLAMGLDSQRFESLVCSLWRCDTPAEQAWLQRLTIAGRPVEFLASYTHQRRWVERFKMLPSLWRYLAAVQPQIVTCHAEAADALIGWLRPRFARTTLFVRIVHNEREWRVIPWIGPKLYHLYPLLYDVEVGTSEALMQSLQARPSMRWLPRRITYLPNGISLQVPPLDDTASLRQELGLTAAAFVVGSVGRLEIEKGFSWLLRAFRQFSRSCNQAHLVVVGEGTLRKKLEQESEALGLQNLVHFLGARPDSLQLIQQFDLFVSSSLSEGLATVIMEAMLVGTPVVATRVSGSTQLILPHQTGILVPVQNVDALSQAIAYCYHHPEECRSYAHAAHQHVQQYDFEHIIAKYEIFYQQLQARQL